MAGNGSPINSGEDVGTEKFHASGGLLAPMGRRVAPDVGHAVLLEKRKNRSQGDVLGSTPISSKREVCKERVLVESRVHRAENTRYEKSNADR